MTRALRLATICLLACDASEDAAPEVVQPEVVQPSPCYGGGYDARGAPSCLDGAVCLTESNTCYPREGTSPERCGEAEPFVIDIVASPWARPGEIIERNYTGVVSEHANGEFVVETPTDRAEVAYTIGPFVLPIAVGDQVVLTLRWVPGFAVTVMGLALRSQDGRLLALVDEGQWDTAWTSRNNTFEQRGGFDITTEPMGCAAIDNRMCFASIPLGVRATLGAATVLVPPGEAIALATPAGNFEVVNAWAETLAVVDGIFCTDQSPRRAWAILATPE